MNYDLFTDKELMGEWKRLKKKAYYNTDDETLDELESVEWEIQRRRLRA